MHKNGRHTLRIKYVILCIARIFHHAHPAPALRPSFSRARRREGGNAAARYCIFLHQSQNDTYEHTHTRTHILFRDTVLKIRIVFLAYSIFENSISGGALYFTCPIDYLTFKAFHQIERGYRSNINIKRKITPIYWHKFIKKL